MSDCTRTYVLFALFYLFLLFTACSAGQPECQDDNYCDRPMICQKGVCVDPKSEGERPKTTEPEKASEKPSVVNEPTGPEESTDEERQAQDGGVHESTPEKEPCIPKKEACNGKDDDCDGSVDNIKGSAASLTAPCYEGPKSVEGIGKCKRGEKVCHKGAWGGCKGFVKPTSEICNGEDDDCDGKVDNDIKPKPCYSGPKGTERKGECKQGTQQCTKGKWSNCQNEVTPKAESCNKKDDDCDGLADEGGVCGPCQSGQTRSCYSGPSGTKSKGLCKAGTQKCNASGTGWEVCIGEVSPKKESCNGKDDDCDGQNDEDFAKLNQACSIGKGECLSAGKLVCSSDGTKLVCNAPTKKPSTEICNKKDDDCDGSVDENGVCGECAPNQSRPCYDGPAGTKNKGPCKEGKQTCTSLRKWGACVGQVKPKRESCNGKDDDCDGRVDEDFTRLKQACSIGKGECLSAGKLVCSSDGSKLVCNASVKKPSTEICNKKDDDCDGQVDEGNVCGDCTPNQSRPCYDGPSGTRSKGTCQDGKQMCTAQRKWGICTGQVKPQSEVCNGKDDNCNGSIDDNVAGVGKDCSVPGKKGECAKGKSQCIRGTMICPQTIQPTTKESCGDGKDNDCDGQTDEGCFPKTSWAQGIGDSSSDSGNDIAVDSKGNVYVVGDFNGWVYFGSKILRAKGPGDIFITKLDPTGKILWAERAGNADSRGYGDRGHGIAIDRQDNVVITGSFYGKAQFGSTILTGKGSVDVFVAKLDTNGKWLWAQRAGGAKYDRGLAIATNASSEIYVLGVLATKGDVGKTTLRPSGITQELFVAKLSAKGVWEWAQIINGSTLSYRPTGGIAVDSKGDVYVTGGFNKTLKVGGTTLVFPHANYIDVFIAKLNAKGIGQWAVRTGGSTEDFAFDLFAQNNRIYVTGAFVNTADFGSFKMTSKGGSDIFVAALSDAGKWLWVAQAGSVKDDTGFGVTADAAGNVYVTGEFEKTASFGSSTLTSSGEDDAFVAKLTSSGKWQWALSAKGITALAGKGVSLDMKGGIYVTGAFSSKKASFGSVQVAGAARGDIFIWKLK